MKKHSIAGRTHVRSVLFVYEERDDDPDFPVAMKAVFRPAGETEDLVVKLTEDGLDLPCEGDGGTTWTQEMQRVAKLAAAESWGEDYGTTRSPEASRSRHPRRPWWRRLLRLS